MTFTNIPTLSDEELKPIFESFLKMRRRDVGVTRELITVPDKRGYGEDYQIPIGTTVTVLPRHDPGAQKVLITFDAPEFTLRILANRQIVFQVKDLDIQPPRRKIAKSMGSHTFVEPLEAVDPIETQDHPRAQAPPAAPILTRLCIKPMYQKK